MPITQRFEDAYIKDAYTEKGLEICSNKQQVRSKTMPLLVNAQEAQSIEEDLSQISYIAFGAASKALLANNWISMGEAMGI